ncbi:neural cell adhesion molecule L1.1-like isoform X1 [Brachyistius frenatus]|uniref:neural cell adhesion molecule L1.1-like isoform X1 n=2 Tax=Brachyistius frenatus TaxID=100188 RepID=UPI0037E86950
MPDMSQPPVLTKIPMSYTAFSQEDINLPCEASGNPTPTFRWVKDGEEFGEPRNGSGTLRAKNNDELELYEGFFRCYASNVLGTAMTETIKVIVEPQPVLPKQQKVEKDAYEGESLILSCNPPESSTPPHIHWMDRNMVHIKQSDRVMVGLDGNLYFSNLIRKDTRNDYICNAQYAAAWTILPDTAVTLTVVPSNNVIHGRKPRLFIPEGHRSSVLALRGHSITLECIPKGLPTPKVEWKKKDGSLEETGGELDNHNRWLHFEDIGQNDDGEYECRASNTHGSIAHSFSLAVEASPYWVKEPQNLQYAPGETVRLECQAEGIPTPVIDWSINGQPIRDVDSNPRRSVNGGVLILQDVEFSDNAVYQCEAANKHGSILLNTFLYVVELPPQILSSDAVVYKVVDGGDVKLLCESFGSPRPHITWEREDFDPLLSDPRVALLTDGTIELSNVSYADVGEYTCSITNSNISITANLEVFNPTVIRNGPQDVHVDIGSSALLDCDFDRDPRLNAPQVIWKKDAQKLQESSPDDKYTIFENNTLKLTDVQSHDTARYSCEVITQVDHVNAVGSLTVVAPPAPPRLLTLSDVEDHSLTLNWIPGPSHNSPIIGFVVEGREEQHREEARWTWEELKQVSGEFSHVQLSLHPFCTYRFRVAALNNVGRSNWSIPSEHRSTPPAVPDRNPTGVRSNSNEPGTLIITWDEMDKRSHNGQDFQYVVSWREVEGPNARWNDGDAKSPPFLVNNTGTYTPFEIKVRAVNAIGGAPAPEAEIGHSGEDIPEEPPTGVSTTVMNSTVLVKWNKAQKVRGLLLGYKIYVRRSGPQDGRHRRALGNQRREDKRDEREKRKDNDSRVVVVHGNKTSQEVPELRLFSRYEVWVTAFNSKGESPPSPPHNFRTPEGAPGPPASLRFDSPTEKSVILYWTPPLEPNGLLLGYMVQYQQVGESGDGFVQMEQFRDPAVTHMLLDPLDPSSRYHFKVNARTAAGDGPPAELHGATLLDGVPPTNVTVVSGSTSFNLSWVPGERDRNHGFNIRYVRKTHGTEWEESEELNSTQGFYSLTGLKPGSQYHLIILHGNVTQWEDVMWTSGPVPSEMPEGFAAQGWLIGLISAILLLALILLILCLIKRSKGGKYAVKDKEDKEVDSEARPMKDETFGEYRSLESDADEKRSDSQPSLCGESKLGSDDSLAEYGDSVDIQFNEDGSFIGQYSGRGPVPHGNESSGPASPDNAVPPPPIAPSMSSILNRPS